MSTASGIPFGWSTYSGPRTVDAKVSELLGKTLISVQNKGDEVWFVLDTAEQYKMCPGEYCGGCIRVEDVIGDLKDLIGSPIIMAEEATGRTEVPGESYVWTFYRFATVKGYVTIRWNGETNGYYSESVDFLKLI